MKKLVLLIFISGLLSLSAFSQYLFTIDVSANYIGFDSKRELIYASVKGSDAIYANSLVSINPYSGVVINSVFIGSEPTEFVFTTDSNYLFIMFDEQPVVKKFNLNSFSVVQEINLGVDPYNGAYYGKSMAVLPDNDSIIIVSRKQKGVSPDFGGVAVYSNGVKLPWETQDHHGPEYLLNTQNDILYAYEDDFFTLKVDVDSGIVVLNETDDLWMRGAKFENGLVFDDKGKVVNPITPIQIGQFPIEDTYEKFAHQADSSKNKVFFAIVGDNDKDIEFFSYNRTTFAKITEYKVTDVISSDIEDPESKQLIRFGEKGLAIIIEESWPFNEPKSMIGMLNNSNFVDSISIPDTSELAQLYVLDTVYTYEHITVYDTLDVYNYVTVYDTTHLSTTDTLIVYQTNSIVNGNIIKSEISLYPNPSSNYINVEITNSNVIENYNIKFYNTVGELLFDSRLTSDLLTIDISSYSKGTYILTLTDNWGQRIATKYVVVK
jgi:hypothetical protein